MIIKVTVLLVPILGTYAGEYTELEPRFVKLDKKISSVSSISSKRRFIRARKGIDFLKAKNYSEKKWN